jgi:ferredoxin-NADP reductase
VTGPAAITTDPAVSAGMRRNAPFDRDLVVLSRCTESDGVVSLELGLGTGEPLPAWEPGAHIDVVLSNSLTRQYSLSGAVDNRKTWRIGVLREHESRGGSQWIHDQVQEGTEIRVRGPRNNFPLLPSPRYLFIAGGIGITPLLPMVARAREWGADWMLYYCGRTRASMAFIDELEPYGERAAVRPTDETGRLDLAAILEPPAVPTLIYCCGPAELMDAVEACCESWSAGSLRVERFAANPSPAEHDGRLIEVELRSSGLMITVPPELSILQAVENAGVQVISSCTEGICGSCETAVLEGEVAHRDSLLTEEERAANDTMLICVSRVKCGRLVLDL